jgi:predicted LPLAT superfamily acyltransferase
MLIMQWKKNSQRGCRVAFKIMRWIALHCPRQIARIFLYPTCLYYLLFSKTSTQASKQFLSRARNKKVRWFNIYKHYHSFASTLLDRPYFLVGKTKDIDVEIINQEIVISYIEKKQGCLFFGSHLGSFEVLRHSAQQHPDIPMKMLFNSTISPLFTEYLHELNPKMAESIIEIGRPESLLQVDQALSDGKFVGILSDRVTDKENNINCQFLGEDALFSTRPFFLASLLKVPVILFFGLYLGRNRYKVIFEDFSDEIKSNDLTSWIQKYVERLEYYAKKYPYNWFNFYDYWNQNLTGEIK